MMITKRAVGLVGGALTCVMTLAVGGAIALAAAPPFDPDPDAYGTITFFDAAGNVITSGTNAAESPKYAVASTNPTSTVLNKRANLALFNPQAGQPTGNWNGTQMNTNTLYPLSTAPASVSSSTFPATTQTAASQSFAAIAATFVPNTGALANVFQVRLRSVQLPDYASASITVDPATGAWQQVFPEPGTVPPAVPPVDVPPTDSPTTAPSSSDSPTTGPSSSDSPTTGPSSSESPTTGPSSTESSTVEPTSTESSTVEPTSTAPSTTASQADADVVATDDPTVLGSNISGSGSGTSPSSDAVSSRSGIGGALPRTGSEVLRLVGFATLLLVLGAACVRGARRLTPVSGKHV